MIDLPHRMDVGFTSYAPSKSHVLDAVMSPAINPQRGFWSLKHQIFRILRASQ
jgi:hypothetical protein